MRPASLLRNRPGTRLGRATVLFLVLATGCTSQAEPAPRALSSGPTSTDVIAALTAPLTSATRISMQLAPQAQLTATRDPAGSISIESSVPPAQAASVFVNQPLGSVVIRNDRALWHEPRTLENHSLPNDAWIDVPLASLAIDRGHRDAWSSIAHLVTDVVLKDVDLSSLLLVEIEDADITDLSSTSAPLRASPATANVVSTTVREEFHFSNDTHDVTVALDAELRLSSVVVEAGSSSTSLTASYESQPYVLTPSRVLNAAQAAPIVDEITAPARLENLTTAALRLDALLRASGPAAAGSLETLRAVLLAQDVLNTADLELASSTGPVTVWSNGRLDEAALKSAATEPAFLQLRQRNVTVCLRLSRNGDTFTFLSPDEDLSKARPGYLPRDVLARDPGSVISATSISAVPACRLVAPPSGERRW